MYEKLDLYISQFSKEESSDDYWYDIGVIHASELISDFSEKDWNELMKHIDEKNDMWKKRYVYCLGDNNNTWELNAVLKIIDTKDDELYVMCIDAFRDMMNEENKDIIQSQKNIDRAKKMILQSGVATKTILEQFLKI